MMNRNPNIGWLPSSKNEEFDVANKLFDYGVLNNTYSLLPFACVEGIDVRALEELSDKNNDGYLPTSGFFAIKAITDRQKKADGFCEMVWQNAKGSYSKALYLFDAKGNLCFEQFTEVIIL